MDIITLSNMRSDIFVIVKKPKNYIDHLPLELRSKIIKTVLNLIVYEDNGSIGAIDQKFLEKYVLDIPIFLGVKHSNRFAQLQKVCRSEIAEKKFLAHELFCSSHKDRKVFINIYNRSSIKNFIEGNVSDEDCAAIEAMDNKSIKKGLKLKLLNENKIATYMDCAGMGSFYVSFCVIAVLELSGHSFIAKLFNIPFFGGLFVMAIAQLLMKPENRFGEKLKTIEL